MAKRARYPRGHTFSPSVIKTMRQCFLRHWMKKVRRLPDPPGPQAQVGNLVHRVLELAALRRCDPPAGADPAPDEADVTELLSLLAEVQEDDGEWVLTEARETLEAAAPVDFSLTISAEGIIDQHDIGDGYTVGAILDRVDAWEEDDGIDHVHIVDYKTGFIPPRDELVESDQANLYLDYGAAKFGIRDERLVMVFYWPGENIRIGIRYDEERVAAGVESAKRIWRRWEEGKHDRDNPPEATLGVHCAHCPYRDQCNAYQEHIRKPARVHPWEGLELDELVKLRHQVAGDAKMLKEARLELDRHLVKRLDRETKDGRYEDDFYRAKVQRDSLTNYSMGVVEALARATGLDLEDVMRAVCSIGSKKLTAFVNRHREKHPRVTKVIDAYATPSMKSPYIRASAKDGLF